NAAGQRTGLTEGSLGTTTTSYDAFGRVASILNRHGETTTFAYDGLGRVSRKTFSSGQYEEFGYDSRSRVTSVTLRNSSNTVLRATTYSYDAANQ
ncbi:hypothetical protein, partial [Tolypothrix sp. VBCCA 56010]|uniref:hypothetical protein n=1 Tax=Tolypothrix sp. VBCCA 56010 TaxID=3137731 RepID=UPI003D7DC186